MLIKNAEALERLADVDTLVVDKTGTLTEGRPKVTAVLPAGGIGARTSCCGSPPAWSAAASIPSPKRSSRRRRSAGSRSPTPSSFEAITGKGVRGRVDGEAVALGNAKLLDALGIRPGVRRRGRRPSVGARARP